MMKKLLPVLLCLLLLAAPLLSGCKTVEQAKDVLGSDEAKDMIKDNWNALTEEVNETTGEWRAEAEKALSDILPKNMDDYTVVSEAALDAAGITEIEIDWVAGRVDVVYYDGDEIRFTESAAEALSDAKQMRYRQKGNELRIVYCANGTVDIPKKALRLELPRAMAGSLSDLSIDLVSADASIEGISAAELDVESVSGSAALTDISAAEFDFDSVSGGLELTFAAAPREIELNTVSGRLSLQLPSDAAGYALDFSTVSGTFEGRDGTKGGEGNYSIGDGSIKIRFDSVSGDLRIS